MTSELSQLGFLLFVSALVAILTRRLRLPYTVGLVLAGMGLYFLHVRMQLHLSKDLIFSVFLPPLVFEAALCISWREFKKDLPVVSLLATVGVVLAAAVTAGFSSGATPSEPAPHTTAPISWNVVTITIPVRFDRSKAWILGQFVSVVTDQQRLAMLGLARIYGARNPFAFMELQDVQELTNFFERKVSAYQIAVQGDVAFDQAF